MRRTNISDGNSITRFFSRWIRWISTGMAIAPRPARNSGVRKDIRPASHRAGLQVCSRLAGSPEGLRYVVAGSPEGLRYVVTGSPEGLRYVVARSPEGMRYV